MCLTAPARVISTDGDDATVELDGRVRHASLAVLPETKPGDWVIVGAGTILRRLDPVDAEDVRTRIAAARAATALRGLRPRRPVPGEPPGSLAAS